MGARAPVEGDAGARARAERDPAREVVAVARRGARREHQLHEVALQCLREVHPEHLAPCIEDGRRIYPLRPAVRSAGIDRAARLLAREAQDRLLGLSGRVADPHEEQEAVELGLGQGVGALLLDRVLGRHDEEQRGERIGGAPDRDLALPHRFEQCGLHLRGGPVHLVGEQHVVEQRAALEHEARGLRAVDLGAGEIGGEQVGGELHPVEVALDAGGERLHRGRLREPRRTFHQQVAVGEQGDEKPVDERLLADDPGAQGAAQPAELALCP